MSGYVGLGLVEAPANWGTMTMLEKAIYELRSADATPTAEGMLWGGQCMVDIFGPDVCLQARAIVNPIVYLDTVEGVVTHLIRYGTCGSASEALCAEAKARVAGFRAGAPLLPTPTSGPISIPRPAPVTTWTTPLPTLPTTPETSPTPAVAYVPLDASQNGVLVEEWISGVPNWAVAVGAAVVGAGLLFGRAK